MQWRRIFTDTFKYPVFVSWFQQVVGLLLYVGLGELGAVFPPSMPPIVPRFRPSWRTAKAILPLTLSFVGMISFSNTCLLFVQVSTYQVARSLTLLFNLVLSYLVLGHVSSVKVRLACVLVVSGFLVGSFDPSTLQLLGVITGACSSVFQAIYMVFIKRAIIACNNDQNVVSGYNFLLASVLFLPAIYAAGEAHVWRELLAADYHVWGWLLLSGLLSSFFNVTSFWCVRVTSPLTFNVVGYGKACLQSLGGIVVLGDKVTAKSTMGIMLTLAGSFWYGQIKVAERGKERAAEGKKEDGEVRVGEKSSESSAVTTDSGGGAAGVRQRTGRT
ncbi:unnamed protein product [Vitrella brassicaformis CCMP3155]|uniref:Sugar phosphate transporter domain-containing protein n=1 Tax=Vitrella brassicaformis (strain CCMP3155) TaxID=1169540 RepID=A0A0G4E8D0_VITBC|nr:unnamed protein product [Vitrella brassicaformis CCMP3155]|eukprot:CEL91689.1 unnamed protein product [Vitrella brassicaformis CCMP3155]